MVHLSQVIVIPCGITASLSADERKSVFSQCEQFVKELNAAGIRCRGDFKDNYSPGWKFNHWELKGVPIRVEIGPRDVKENNFIAVVRDMKGVRQTISIGNAVEKIRELMEEMHIRMFER